MRDLFAEHCKNFNAYITLHGRILILNEHEESYDQFVRFETKNGRLYGFIETGERARVFIRKDNQLPRLDQRYVMCQSLVEYIREEVTHSPS